MTFKQLYQVYLKCSGISTDSRNISENSLFFALKGDQFDGNLFASSALANGAAFAFVDDPGIVSGERFILVKNVLTTLQQLASFHRKQLGLPVIAITGTNGKTTTKELVTAVLSQKYHVGYTRGNLNNHIGVPLTLLSFTHETGIGVVEMGANHPGEIDFLCHIADPDLGIITNVGKAHLEGFGNFEEVIRAKSELYRYLGHKEDGTIFINMDNQYLKKAAGNRIRKVTYGTDNANETRGEILPSFPYLNLRVCHGKESFELTTKLTGNYNFENVLCAVAVGRFFDVDPVQIKNGIENYTPSNYRSQLIRSGSNTIIMDAYNANPSSMQASVENFLQFPGQKKTFILGDMLELGSDSIREHQEIIRLLEKYKAEEVYLVGSNFHDTIKPDYFHSFGDADELLKYISGHPFQNSLILVKGSHGIKLEKVMQLFN